MPDEQEPLEAERGVQGDASVLRDALALVPESSEFESESELLWSCELPYSPSPSHLESLLYFARENRHARQWL